MIRPCGLIAARLAAAIAAICIAAMNGCATTAPAPTPPPPSATFALLEELPPQGVLRVEDLMLIEPGARRYLVLNDEGRVEGEVTITRSTTDRFNATLVDEEDQRSAEFWRIEDDGRIVMPAHIDHAENAVSHFDPPLVIAFDELPAGEARSSEAMMRVIDLNQPNRMKEMGKATRTVEYAADQRIRTPMGEFVAHRVESRFVADLRMARADERSTRYYVPGIGMVVEQMVVQVQVLGTFTTTTSRTIVLSP